MILKQFYLACLSHASYLIGDEITKRAIIVDPRRDVTEYLDFARDHDLHIEGVINTHFHADFVSGHLELLDATGAWIGFGAAADTDYPIRRLRHGEHISLGQVDIEVLDTPGHTWESISLLIREDGDDTAAAPQAVLTGDSLFIGDVGRPDLANLGDGSTTDLARAMYRTVHQTLMRLPDDVAVMPAHGAGSSCGKNLSTALVSSIGEQRRTNPSVQPMSEDDFVRLITDGQPAVPGYFSTDADLNRRTRTVFDESRSVPELSAAQLRARLTESPRTTVVIDTRSPDEFAAGHLAGAVNVGLAGRYAETCGMVAHVTDPIVVVTAPGDEQEAALRLARIGYDHVAGYYPATVAGFPEELADLVRHTDRVGPQQLAELIAADAVTVLDVRNTAERDTGRITGSVHIPLAELLARHSELPQHRPVVAHCAGGWRSSVAASLLRAHGHHETTDLVGGYGAWAQCQLGAA